MMSGTSKTEAESSGVVSESWGLDCAGAGDSFGPVAVSEDSAASAGQGAAGDLFPAGETWSNPAGVPRCPL